MFNSFFFLSKSDLSVVKMLLSGIFVNVILFSFTNCIIHYIAKSIGSPPSNEQV